jgi:hypothetical protein
MIHQRAASTPRWASLTALAAIAIVASISSDRAFGQGAVAFQPTIATFPDGVILNAYPVVSHDRRYVRLGVEPQFITLEEFNTFIIPGAVSGGGLGGIGGGLGGIGGGLGGGFGGGLGGGVGGGGNLGGFASMPAGGLAVADPLAGAYVRSTMTAAQAQPSAPRMTSARSSRIGKSAASKRRGDARRGR